MKPRTWVILSMFIAAAAARLLPHYPNATPVTAMALFGGACFMGRRGGTLLALAIPLGAMLISDLALGMIASGALGAEGGWAMAFHDTQIVVYGCFAIAVGFGGLIRHHRTKAWAVCGSALTSSVVFFAVTNFAVWATGTMYPKTFEGLMACYAAGLAFVEFNGATVSFGLGQVAGDLFYTSLLFGALAAAERFWPALREEPAPAQTA